MQRPAPTDLNIFTRQLEAMYLRLGQLYTQIDHAQTPQTEMFPSVLKELGIAAEELQVATETLHQQNEQMATNLELATTQTQYYQALFDHAPQAQVITNLEGRIQVVNQAATRLLKLSQTHLINRPLIRFLEADDRVLFRSQLARLQQFRLPLVWASYLQAGDGDRLDLTLSAAVIHSPELPEATVHWLIQETPQLQAVLAKSLENRQHSQDQQISQDEAAIDALTLLEQRGDHRYTRGDIISFQPQTLWYVVAGLVKLTTLSENNEEILLGLVGAGMPFAIGSPSLLTYQAVALTDARLASVAIAEIESQPGLAARLLAKLQQRLQQTEALLNVIGQRRAKDRLNYFLQLLKREIGQPLEDSTVRLSVRLTHEDLANACGTTRVTITRLLGNLQRQNKIAFDSKSHIILCSHF